MKIDHHRFLRPSALSFAFAVAVMPSVDRVALIPASTERSLLFSDPVQIDLTHPKLPSVRIFVPTGYFGVDHPFRMDGKSNVIELEKISLRFSYPSLKPWQQKARTTKGEYQMFMSIQSGIVPYVLRMWEHGTSKSFALIRKHEDGLEEYDLRKSLPIAKNRSDQRFVFRGDETLQPLLVYCREPWSKRCEMSLEIPELKLAPTVTFPRSLITQWREIARQTLCLTRTFAGQPVVCENPKGKD